MFYSFNSRMIPDSVEISIPKYRKLAERTEEELELLEKLKAKLEKTRKSRSVKNVKGKNDSPELRKMTDSKAVSEKEPDIIAEVEEEKEEEDDIL